MPQSVKPLHRSSASKFWITVLKAGLLVGALDILSALLYYYIRTQKNPLNVFTFIASGVFGKKAFAAGSSMLIWGAVFHFIIALSFTLLFFLVYPVLIKFLKSKVLFGILYGVFIWVVMNLLVLPLTNAPALSMSAKQIIIGSLILITMIGLPLSFIAGKYYSRS